jgi:hypothetical protein
MLQVDADDDASDQPFRFIESVGQCRLLHDLAGIRAMPGRLQTPAEGERRTLDDAVIEGRRVGMVVTPGRIRTEGFFPGPRFPVNLALN